jgi:hypothetical protein
MGGPDKPGHDGKNLRPKKQRAPASFEAGARNLGEVPEA